MTRALTVLNDAEDIGQEAPKTEEPKYLKPTEPVIAIPAEVPASRIAEAVAAARKAKDAMTAERAAKREALEEALSASEPARDEILEQAEEIINASAKSPEAKAVAKVLVQTLNERRETIRNVRQTLGVTIGELNALGEDVESQLSALIGGNGAMREAIRMICEAAGTVRIDELVPVKAANGGISIIRRFVDVGDEEPDQDPIVDLKWLIPAALRAASRYRVLLNEHSEAVKASVGLQQQLANSTTSRMASERELLTTKERMRLLEKEVQAIRPNAPGTPVGYYLKSEDGKWVAKHESKSGGCFLTRWCSTTDVTAAYGFPHMEDASEVLHRLQMSRLHRIRLKTRETLRIVVIRYEDHTD